MQRTYANPASTEFDAVIVVGETPPADDALVSLDAKAGAGSDDADVDPRVLKLLGEAWRHAKAIGATSDAPALPMAGIASDAPGATVSDGAAVAGQVIEQLGGHRVWERFPSSIGA